MADYIDKQKTLTAIFEITENVIRSLPSADVVEVVRCKDCKYKYLENMVWTCPFGMIGGPDHYCSYGERK